MTIVTKYDVGDRIVFFNGDDIEDDIIDSIECHFEANKFEVFYCFKDGKLDMVPEDKAFSTINDLLIDAAARYNGKKNSIEKQ